MKGWKYKIRPLSEKRKMVELFREGEIPLAEIAKQFGVHTSTLTQHWFKQVDKDKTFFEANQTLLN